MKNIILPILLFINLGFSQGNDRFGTYISQWYDTMLMLTDTTYTGNNGQWIQDGRGNLTNIFLDYLNGRVGIGTGTPGTTFDIAGDLTISLDILLDSTPASDHTASGSKFIFTAGETVNFGDAVYQLTADGEYYLADATDETELPASYMALETITDGNTGEFLETGIARDDSWALTKGDLVYISITGTTGNTLTQTPPSGSSEVVQIFGRATSAVEIDVNPNLMLIVLVP